MDIDLRGLTCDDDVCGWDIYVNEEVGILNMTSSSASWLWITENFSWTKCAKNYDEC